MFLRKIHDKVKADYKNDLYQSEYEQENYFLQDKITETKRTLASLAAACSLLMIVAVNGGSHHSQWLQYFIIIVLVINLLALLVFTIKLWRLKRSK